MNLSRATYQKYFVFDVNGHPLNGGRVSTYVDGTSTPAVTYKDREGTIKNPTTITLDSRGEAEIWLDTSVTYKFVVTDKHGRLVGQYDHVTANTKTFSAEVYTKSEIDDMIGNVESTIATIIDGEVE